MSAPPTMTAIPHMDEGRPLKSINAGFGNQWLQEIQRALKTQFPSVGESVVIVSAEELNALKDAAADKTIEERLVALEQASFHNELPAAALDFKDAWWNLGKDVVPYNTYVIETTRVSIQNAPFAWGTGIFPGDEQNSTLILVQRSVSDSDDPAVDQLWIQDLVAGDHRHCYRATDRRSAMTAHRWFTNEQTEHSTVEGDSGAALSTSICDTYSQRCT